MKENRRKASIPKAHRPNHPGVPALEWLSDISGRAARATAIGSRRILIENHTGIQDFTDECVQLSTAAGQLCIHGRNLSLYEVRENALIVHGVIRQVNLPEDGGPQ